MRKGCGNYAAIVLSKCKEPVAILLAFEHKTKSFQIKSVGTDQYTVIEQSGNYPNWQIAFKVQKIGLFSDSGNRNLMNFMKHKRAQWRHNRKILQA